MQTPTLAPTRSNANSGRKVGLSVSFVYGGLEGFTASVAVFLYYIIYTHFFGGGVGVIANDH